jgi:hypothetical protein
MAYEIPAFNISLPAAGDLSASQFRAVSVNSSGQIAAAGVGVAVAGILQDKPGAVGRAGNVMVLGVSKWEAGAAITAGERVAADATGRCKPAVAAATDTSDAGVAADPLIGSHVAGIALETASGAGIVISVLLLPMGAAPTTAA